MLGRLKKRETRPTEQDDPCPDSLVDQETGLPGAARFEELLQRQISRDLRYGSTSALALFEIGLAERAAEPQLSPAPFVSKILQDAVRGSDVVARVSTTMFAVLLIEATAEGAAQFTERVRTKIGSSPYARRADGSGLYARAWAGVAPWSLHYTTVEEYAQAAEQALAATFVGYEAAQEWFRGEGLNKPFIA